MTVKCCRDCLYAKTNSVFPNQAECDIWRTEVPPRPAKSTLDTFYCGAFTRRNSAKKIGQIEETTTENALISGECQCEEDFTDGTPFCQNCGRKRVIPEIRRRFI